MLITGKNSYIGDSLESWLLRNNDEYYVSQTDVKGEEWRSLDFSEIDVVCHVAGIAHIKERSKNAMLFYEINRDLAYEVAIKAKAEGVAQFIYISSMSIYGKNSGMITRNTVPRPRSHYGKSKYEAEKLLESLADNHFLVAILRPPMVYGKGCKGNYRFLSRLAGHLPVFPDFPNSRSAIYIDNLCMYIQEIIHNCRAGTYHPQNLEYICTSEIVFMIAKLRGRKIVPFRMLNNLIRLIKIGSIEKAFGSLTYDFDITNNENVSRHDFIGLDESLYAIENDNN